MPYSHQNVTLRGFHWEVSSLTFNLATGIVAADIGKAVSVDATGPNKVKLAADGDIIVGRLASVESRSVEGTRIGAVELQFANVLPMTATVGDRPAVGDTVIGSGAGLVKKAAANNARQNFVAEIIGTDAVVVQI